VILRRPLHVSEKCSGRRREPLVLRSSKLLANFDGTGAQRTKAYVDQFTQDHPDADLLVAGADAQLAVAAFAGALLD
jgi:hypothetical protein